MISSDWPVCPGAILDPASDGAALTYARRYALFTLVRIAGDVDAPDLNIGNASSPQSETSSGVVKQSIRSNRTANDSSSARRTDKKAALTARQQFFVQ